MAKRQLPKCRRDSAAVACREERGGDDRKHDERTDGEPLEVRFTGALTAQQETAASAMLAHELGVLCAPPGIGKTVIATRLIAARRCSTLVLVHRKPLLDQWVTRLSEFLELEEGAIGTIGGGGGKPTGKLDVAMVQSLARRETLTLAASLLRFLLRSRCRR